MTVKAIGEWKNNAEMIRDLAALGYIHGRILDPTYGLGRFWTVHRPDELTGCDLNPRRSPLGRSVDFTALPFQDGSFDTVTFDPPYKLNGTGGSHAADDAYGVANSVRWQDRMQLCRDGITDCIRVLRLGGHLLVKCQDQVCSAHVRWQTIDFANHAGSLGCDLVDMAHLPSYRAQPMGRSQQHLRRNYSTMLVLVRAKAVEIPRQMDMFGEVG